MQQTLSSLCNLLRECFGPLRSSHSENERVALQSAKKKEENKDICLTSVWVHFQMFSAELKGTQIILTDTQTTMQSKVDSSVATWEKSSPSHVILNHREHTHWMSETQTNEKTDRWNKAKNAIFLSNHLRKSSKTQIPQNFCWGTYTMEHLRCRIGSVWWHF